VADRAGNRTVFTWNFVVDVGFSQDTQPPAIQSISPAQNETVNNLTPEIVVTYTDELSGIDTSSVRLIVNGTDVTALSDVDSFQLIYLPGEEMAEGKVTAKLALRDIAGNNVYRTWEFTIKSHSSEGSSGETESGSTADTNTDIQPSPTPEQRSSLSLAGRVTEDGIMTEMATLVSRDGRLSLVLDKGASAVSNDNTPLEAITVEPSTSAPALPDDLMPVGLIYQLGPGDAILKPSITVKLGYIEQEAGPDLKVWDVNCNGSLDTFDVIKVQNPGWSGKTADAFFILGYDDAAKKWLSIDSTLDPDKKLISAESVFLKYFTLACPASPSAEKETDTRVSSFSLAGKIDSSGVLTSDVVLESSDASKRLEIQQGTAVLNQDSKPVEGITIADKDTSPEFPESYCRIGTACELGPDGITFDKPVVLTLSYEESVSRESIRWDSNGDGTIDFLDKDISVAPEDFRIAYYDTSTAAWVFLESIVNQVAKTVTAEVDHFTLFALVAPATEQLVVESIDIDPDIIDLGEEIAITVTVENPGKHRGTYIVPLEIEGVFEDSKEVTLSPGESEIVFMHKEPYTGTHEVSVLGKTAEFTVRESSSSRSWWDSTDVVFYLYIIIGLLSVLVIVGIIILAKLRKRRAD
jgi:hypothetical protein